MEAKDIATPLWDKLGFVYYSALDYPDAAVAPYDPLSLLRAARLLKSAARTGKSIGPTGRGVAELLRQLARSGDALRALNAETRAPGQLFGLNVALHALAKRELNSGTLAKVSDGEVAKVWNLSDASVRDYLTDHAADASAELEGIVARFQQRHGSRAAVLIQLDEAMSKRARLSHFARRRTSTSNVRGC